MSYFGTLGWSRSQGCALFMKMLSIGLERARVVQGADAKSDEVGPGPDLLTVTLWNGVSATLSTK